MEKRKLIYSVQELFTDFVKDAKFFIPAYQRGYKWSQKDVYQLLCDIDAFQNNGDDDLFYCLQNITLIADKDGHSFRVVDGQQRLTTLSLILCCFQEYDLVKNKISYAIRKESNLFLQEYVYSGLIHSFGGNDSSVLKEWDKLDLKLPTGESFDFQDIYYMYSAVGVVEDFLKSEKINKDLLREKILHKVKLIVNLPSINESQELELFNNLNGKRVPLDGADLIRAMIITRKPKEDVDNVDSSIKHDILLNENRVKVGLMLDKINAWWTDSNRQKYFKPFISVVKVVGNVRFDEGQYGIDALYKLYTVVCGEKKDKTWQIQLEDFEKIKAVDLYKNLIDLQRVVEYWYSDIELYHLVEFVCLYCKLQFCDLFSKWHEGTKKTFIAYLKSKIKENSVVQYALREIDKQTAKKITEDELNENEDWQEGDETDLILISVLLDVIDIINSQNQVSFEFLAADRFLASKEDKEHIFPRTPLSTDFTKENFNSYLEMLLNYVELQNSKAARSRTETFLKDNLDVILSKERYKEKFRQKINDLLTKEIIPIGSLGNMCLLQGSVNRSYGNDFFTQKHFDIMKKSREGYYIRPHVLDAFTKVMASSQDRNDPRYMQKWDKEDIYSRRNFVVNQIRNFLG